MGSRDFELEGITGRCNSSQTFVDSGGDPAVRDIKFHSVEIVSLVDN